jgi:amino acid permease
MVSKFPIPGGQFALAGRFVSPELGFAMGWLYWYKYVASSFQTQGSILSGFAVTSVGGAQALSWI